MKDRKLLTAIMMILAFIYLPGQLNGQTKKVEFRNLDWNYGREAAKKEGKVIFADVYSERFQREARKNVEEKVFTRADVADALNNNCVNIRINMDTEEGKKFVPYLQMNMYPVYVFFAPNGDLLELAHSNDMISNPAGFIKIIMSAVEMNNVKNSNTRSISFESSTWNEVLARAKQENKLIFMDSYTEWCQPCIKMAKNVFNLDTVADFFNENFINYKMDMEKGTGPALNKKYGITGYPTYLFLDGDGNVVYQFSGYTEPDAFLAEAYKALEMASPEINFFEAVWDQIRQKARDENKLIFFDAYTSWCGPCKMMARDVFTQKKVADYFNENFINVKFDMEKGEGIELKDKFGVNAYPTYLYLDADENVIYKTIGSTTADIFLSYARNALSSDNNLESLNRKYDSGNRDRTFLTGYLEVLELGGYSNRISEVVSGMLGGVPEGQLTEPENWEIIKKYLTDPESREFRYLVSHSNEFISRYGDDVSNKIYKTFMKGAGRFVTYGANYTNATLDEDGFKAYVKEVKKSGFDRADEIIAYAGINNAQSLHDWSGFVKLINKSMKKGVIQPGSLTLYNYALRINQNSDDPALCASAGDWIRTVISDNNMPAFNEPYLKILAELMDKAGDTRAAEEARAEIEKLKVQAGEKGDTVKMVPMIMKWD